MSHGTTVLIPEPLHDSVDMAKWQLFVAAMQILCDNLSFIDTEVIQDMVTRNVLYGNKFHVRTSCGACHNVLSSPHNAR